MRSFNLVILITVSLCFETLLAKELRLATVFANQNRAFDGTAIQLMEGIRLAKEVYERENPKDRVILDSINYEPNLSALVKATQEVIRRKHHAIIGGLMSGDALVMGELLSKKKIVLVSPTSSNPDVTRNRPYVFRMCFSDARVARQLARYTAKKVRPKAVGIIHNISVPYSDYLSTQFLKHFQKLQSKKRPTPILVKKVIVDERDYSQQIDDFIKAGVTHVIILSYDADLKRFVFQAAQKQFFPTYIGSDGLGSNDFIYKTNVKESPFGDKFVLLRNNYWNDKSKEKRVRDFQAAFRKKYRRAPSGVHAIGYDTGRLTLRALKKTDPDGKALREYLADLSPLKLVTNEKFEFGKDRSPMSGMHLYRIDKRGIRYEGKL